MSERKLLIQFVFLLVALKVSQGIDSDKKLIRNTSIQISSLPKKTPGNLQENRWDALSHTGWTEPSWHYLHGLAWSQSQTSGMGQRNALRRQGESHNHNHNEQPREEEFQHQSHSDNMKDAGHSQHSENQVESHSHNEPTHEDESTGSNEDEEELTTPGQLLPVLSDLTFLTLVILYLPLIVPTILIPLAFYVVGIILIPIVRVNYFINHKDDGEDGRQSSIDEFISSDINIIFKDFVSFLWDMIGFEK